MYPNEVSDLSFTAVKILLKNQQASIAFFVFFFYQEWVNTQYADTTTSKDLKNIAPIKANLNNEADSKRRLQIKLLWNRTALVKREKKKRKENSPGLKALPWRCEGVRGKTRWKWTFSFDSRWLINRQLFIYLLTSITFFVVDNWFLSFDQKMRYPSRWLQKKRDSHF